MSNHNLAAGKTFKLLEDLKSAIDSLAARADKLDSEFHARTAKERQRCEAGISEQNRQLLAAQSEADAAFETAQVAERSRYEQRKTRIGKAYQSSKEQRLRTIDDRTGARKYELQKKTLQAERDRDTGLAAARKAFEDFRESLAAEQEALERMKLQAQKAFAGYPAFRNGFNAAYEKAQADHSKDEHQSLDQLRSLLAQAHGDLDKFKKLGLLRILRYLPVWILLACCEAPLILHRFGLNASAYEKAAGAVLGSFVVVFALRYAACRQGTPLAASLSDALARAWRSHDVAWEKSETRRQQETDRIKAEFQTLTKEVDQQLKRALAEAGESRVSTRMENDERTVHINDRNDQAHQAALKRLEQEHTDALQQRKQVADLRIASLSAEAEKKQKTFTVEHDDAWRALVAEWDGKIKPLYETIASSNALAEQLFPPWQTAGWKSWTPPRQFSAAAKFGTLDVALEKLCQTLPKDKRLALPGPSRLSLPLCLAYPEQGSILLETGVTGHDQAIATLNNLVLRLLSIAPAGRLNFTILDPVGLGQNFAGIMHLADYEELIINSRIWTQSGQIEQKLADLNEHMEKVIQMYLRNEYATIAEYNEQAGVIAEKYHLLVVADFPANFTDVAAKRLLSIAASGAKCGVHLLLHWDRRLALPQDFIPDELKKSCVCLAAKGNDFVLTAKSLAGVDLRLDAPPTPEFAIEFVNQVGRASRDSSRVEVPFNHVAPSEADFWSEDTSSELRVPVGRTGATKLQYLAIGKGTCQHGLVAGKTGSGKSTLFHVIITNLALWCSPEQVEFYLVDFKKGVEFKCYASRRLPHARVVAIESDREFGLSVLQRVDDELRRRGDLFRRLGVQDVAGYKRAGGTEPIPRSLLLIDEFQEFFVEDDKISQTAGLLLDRIVRQGRAFGVHVLLGSQTLGGAYTVARTTLGQMVIRIALQCNEADAYLIMDDTNPAPRLLSRPGEGIYNDMAGALEGNSPFQVVWLPDSERDAALAKVRARADQPGTVYPGPIVFEGNAPADVRENLLLQGLLEAKSIQPAAAGRLWLGAPNSIKGPTEAIFQRQSGNNLLMVGQRDETTLALLSIGLVSLAAQFRLGGARFILCDGTAPDSAERQFVERLAQAVPHPITLVKPGDLAEVMSGLAAEMKVRAEAADPEAAPPVFLIIHGLQKYGKLRFEEEFGFSSTDADAAPNPAAVLNSLLCEGTRLGFHVIATCDSYNNVNRYLSRKAFSEFEMRVLFQMSANDSASLIDNPKASMLGLHRALFFNAQEGHLETFRPYALPPETWIEKAHGDLARLLSAPTG